MELYNQLMALTQDGDAFYFQDFELDRVKYRIFNYRLASYSDFLKPGALECRGIMFDITDGIAELVARPMQKFFNLNENPMTMNLDLSQVDTVELKADGSLMSTFIHWTDSGPMLRLKSKGSLFSEQAIDSLKWLTDHDPELKHHLFMVTLDGYTVNLEWCAPFNRIVIGYEKPHLKILNVRKMETGEYMPRVVIEDRFRNPDWIIDRVRTDGLNTADFVKSIPALQDDIEGYVCRIGDLWFKVKTEKYMSLHHAKDSVNNPRRLFEAIIDEGIDDLRSMFAQDALAMKLIDEMQEKVTRMYNSVVRQVEDYYSANKAKERKDYAIGAQTLSIDGVKLMSLAMNLYIGRDPGFKDFLKGKYKELGFKDTSVDKKED